MSAAPLNTELRGGHTNVEAIPFLFNLAHTTRLSLCLNPHRMAWPVRVANLSWLPNGSWSRLEASVLAQVGASLFASANILVALTRSDML